MKKPKTKRLKRNNTKKYTQCKLNKEEVEELLEKLESKEISMKEVTSLTGVCEKQINNYLKNGVNLEKGHGNVLPNREITFKIMNLLSENYKQSEISKKCDVDSSTLSNQCKVLTYIPRGCLVKSTGFGGYNIIFKVKHYRFGNIFFIRFKINTYILIESILHKEIIESVDLDIEFNTRDNYKSDRIRDIIMKKTSEDYFIYIPIKPTSKLEKEEQIEKYKEFYQRILNDIDYEDIYSSLKELLESEYIIGDGTNCFIGYIYSLLPLNTPTYIIYEVNYKKKNRRKKIQTHTIIPSNYFTNCVIIIYLLIIVLLLVLYTL